MIIHCGLLLLFLNSVITTQYVYDYGLENSATELDQRYSLWPSMHNAARLMRLRKRDAQVQPVVQEGGGVIEHEQKHDDLPTQPLQPGTALDKNKDDKQAEKQKLELNVSDKTNDNSSLSLTKLSPLAHNETADKLAVNKVVPKPSTVSSPGVVKRGIIVFGGFLLLAFAYFIFYRRKSGKNDNMNGSHSMIDANQFRYGVLQSEDKSGSLELSRVPLTMESDDDDDEDLEIFDLEQKKKSLSYVNLQTNDEDLVFQNSTPNSRDTDKDNLLLDIESGGSDTLINWSSNGNKSIL